MNRQTPLSFDLRSAAMLCALAVAWGGSFLWAEIALAELSPYTVALHRVFWAFCILSAVCVCRGEEFPATASAWCSFFVMGALNNAIPFSLIFWGQTTIESGLAAILNGTTAFFGVLVAAVFLSEEPISARKLIGVAIGLVGVVTLIGFDSIASFDIRQVAQLAVLGAALSYALASVWGRFFLQGYSPLMNACGMLGASSFILFIVVLFTDGVPNFSFSAQVWFALIILATVSTAFAYVLYFTILERAGSSNLMLVTLLIPPIAVGLGALFLDEYYGPEALLGFAIIGIGLIVSDGRVLMWASSKTGSKN